jgi:hypothetical protein
MRGADARARADGALPALVVVARMAPIGRARGTGTIEKPVSNK